jgi:pimeloyl-ACP methyl ester carboxylesterase
MPNAVVLVHGAQHGSWCWERVVPLLEERGLDVATLDLPTTGPPGDERPGLADDVAAVRVVLDDTPGQKLLVGHSYGGTVVTAAAAGRADVARLIYLCAAMLDVGESGASVFASAGIDASWLVLRDGLMWPNLDVSGELFLGDCDPATQRAAVERLRPMSLVPHGEPVPEAAWHSIPSTYVVCTLDKAIPVQVQRTVFAPRAQEVLELEASHSPFYSQPRAVAELLAARALG